MSIIRFFNPSFGSRGRDTVDSPHQSTADAPIFAERPEAHAGTPTVTQSHKRPPGEVGAEVEAATVKAHRQYQNLVSLLQDAVGQLEELRADHGEKAYILLQKEAENESLLGTVSRLEAQISERVAAYNILAAEFEDAESQRKNLSARLDLSENEREEFKPFKAKCQELERINSAIRSEIEQIQQAHALLQQQNGTLKSENTRLQKEYYEEKSSAAARDEDYERRDSNRIAEISQLNQVVSSLRQKTTSLEGALAEATENLQSAQVREATLVENLQRLRSDHVALSGNNVRMKREYINQLTEINDLLSKEKMRSEILQEKIAKLEAAMERAAIREQELRNEAFKIRIELKESNIAVYEREKMVKSLIVARDKAGALAEERKQEIERLTSQCEELSQQLNSIRIVAETEAAKVERLDGERLFHKSQAEELGKHVEALSKDRDGLRSERALLLGQLSHYRVKTMPLKEGRGPIQETVLEADLRVKA